MPILSAIALLIFKSSKDPLQGISKLNMMMIVSINQRVTKLFLPTMLKGNEWRTITSEKKKKIDDFVDRMTTLSNLSSGSDKSFIDWRRSTI